MFLDAQDFCRKCREALESPHVSENIHHWIDLIFGYKQRGDEAWKADNGTLYKTYLVVIFEVFALLFPSTITFLQGERTLIAFLNNSAL